MVGDFFLRLKFLMVYLLHLLSEYVFKIVASEAVILGANRFRVTSPSNSWIMWGHENNSEKLREFVWGLDARETQAPRQKSRVLVIRWLHLTRMLFLPGQMNRDIFIINVSLHQV